MTNLIQACSNGHIDEVKSILNKCDIEIKNDSEVSDQEFSKEESIKIPFLIPFKSESLEFAYIKYTLQKSNFLVKAFIISLL